MKQDGKIALAVAAGAAALLFKKNRTVSGIGKLGLQSEKNRSKAIKELQDKLLKERDRIIGFQYRNDVWYKDGSESIKTLAYEAGGRTDEAYEAGERMSAEFNAAMHKAWEGVIECYEILEDIKNGDLESRSGWKSFIKKLKN